MYVKFLSTYCDKRSTISQQLYKPAVHGLSAIAELLVTDMPHSVCSRLPCDSDRSRLQMMHLAVRNMNMVRERAGSRRPGKSKNVSLRKMKEFC